MLAEAYQQQQSQPDPGPALTQIVNQEKLASLLQHITEHQVAELLQHLPTQHQYPQDPLEELRATLLSPAVGQQLQCISTLLKNGQLTLAQVGLPGEVRIPYMPPASQSDIIIDGKHKVLRLRAHAQCDHRKLLLFCFLCLYAYTCMQGSSAVDMLAGIQAQADQASKPDGSPHDAHDTP